ncbi:elongation factor 1-gamma [Tanacetum coccineum]
MMVSDKPKTFLGRTLNGKGPVLETNEGYIYDSNAIARYIAHGTTTFMGKTVDEQALVNCWIDFSSMLDLNIMDLLFLRKGWAANIKTLEKFCISNIKQGFKTLDEHLASRNFLVGDTITLADIITTCDLIWAFEHLITQSFTFKFKHVENYFWKMVEEPKFKKVVGDIEQLKVALP